MTQIKTVDSAGRWLVKAAVLQLKPLWQWDWEMNTFLLTIKDTAVLTMGILIHTDGC